MCLTRSLPLKRGMRSGTGYKVFLVRNGKLVGEYFNSSKPRKTRTWLKAKDFSKTSSINFSGENRSYCSGWHIYVTKPPEKRGNEVIRKVRYRGATQYGSQGVLGVIVAREIYIIPGDPK